LNCPVGKPNLLQAKISRPKTPSLSTRKNGVRTESPKSGKIRQNSVLILLSQKVTARALHNANLEVILTLKTAERGKNIIDLMKNLRYTSTLNVSEGRS